MPREMPYGAFNFTVKIDGNEDPVGGFSDVSGIVTEMTVAEYRAGNSKVNHVQKVPGLHKVSDVTLKRGIVDSSSFWGWITQVRESGPEAKKTIVITLRDEAGQDIQSWTLTHVIPLKYTGPTLAAKASGDVAMEELVLSAEGMEFSKAG